MIKKIIIVSTIASSLFGWSASEMANAKAEARSLNSSFQYKNTTNLNNKIFNPMSGSENVKTLDGSKQARANLTCQGGTYPFVIISYSGVSDITINVKIDPNGDGVIDGNYNFAGVSGIYSSGIAKCTPNTYTNCTYHQWTYDGSTNVLSTIPAPSNTVYSPYCINNSCGSISLLDRAKILDDLTGMISGVIQQSSSDMVITRSETTTTSIELYGQDYSTCSNSNNVYYKAGSSIPDETTFQNQASSVSAPGNPEYDTVMGAMSNENTNRPSDADLADIKTVAKNTSINSSVDNSDPTKANYTLKYKDDNGNWATSSSNSTMAFDPETPPQSCMVTWTEGNNRVYGDNTSGVNNSTVQTIVREEIRECTNNNTVCPIVAGETIKHNCGNLAASLGDSLSALQAAKQMAQDFSCASN